MADPARLFNLARGMVRNLADQITDWSEGAAELFGWSAAQAVGMQASELLRPHCPQTSDEILALLLAHERWQGEIDYRRADGTLVSVVSRRELLRDRAGAPAAVLEVIEDISERVERDALLIREQQARAQAEASAAARDQFLSILSHELRSPLNGIHSWTHVLESQSALDTPLAKRALAGIKTGVTQQVRLIDQLLDATAIMGGKMRLVRQIFALRSVLEAVIERVRPAARAKNIAFNTDLRVDGVRIDGDPDRVAQIVETLLNNALQFTPEGGSIWLSAAERVPAAQEARTPGASQAGEPQEVAISVRDNGRGIGADFLPAVFEPFRQAEGANTRRSGGVGLGLALAKRLAELHQGDVSVESAGEGAGATFTVRLPAFTQPAEPVPAMAAPVAANDEALPSLHGLCVLVIDDQEEARESLSALLGQAGAEVLAADSGQHALDCLEERGEARRPDAVVCDIAMPGEDGYRTLQRIREWEAGKGIQLLGRVPVIALTAFAQREDRARALSAGFQMHLAKPVLPSKLVVVLSTVAAQTH